MELVNPAESRPIATTYFEKFPYSGSKPYAKSTAFNISVFSRPADVKSIHSDISPPVSYTHLRAHET